MDAIFHNDCWGRIRTELRGALGVDAFNNWIEPLGFLGIETGQAQFSVPTSFMGNWVSRNYADAITHLFKAEGVQVSRLSFTAPEQTAPKPQSPTAQNPTA